MSKLERAMSNLDKLLAAPKEWTRGTKIYEPLPGDPNADFKHRLINRAANAMGLAQASRDGLNAKVPLLENDLFFALNELPEQDVEKRDFLELLNATQAVLTAINEAAV